MVRGENPNRPAPANFFFTALPLDPPQVKNFLMPRPAPRPRLEFIFAPPHDPDKKNNTSIDFLDKIIKFLKFLKYFELELSL